MAAITISAPATRPIRMQARPAARTASPVRLTRRGRRLLRTTSSATASVIVQPGDTLWSVAKSVAPQDDPRATIERIATLNNLDTRVLSPGQTLVVPAAG
jgi:nucleoid-associated protein YgaU